MCIHIYIYIYIYIYTYTYIYIYIYIYSYVYLQQSIRYLVRLYLVLRKHSSIRLQVSCCCHHQIYIIYDLKIYCILSIQKYPFMCMSETVQISFYTFKQ